MQNIRAEVHLATARLTEDIGFFTGRLGMRLERIWPADHPQAAVLSGSGLRIRLEQGEGAAGRLTFLANDPVLIGGGETALTAPGGTRVEIGPLDPPVIQPPTEHAFVVRRLSDQAPWVVGRAGMQYRDLIPSRLGGAMIASHIRIPDGGPVPDMVHYHRIGFQLIFCVKGWVDVVYEDQGPKRRLFPGDCFIQPPEIRHRVLEASDGIEVIEIGVPADHVTVIDHDTPLPTATERAEREWEGQRFVHSLGAEGVWRPFRLPGLVARDTGIAEATRGVASVMVVRRGEGAVPAARHRGDILFGYVLAGTMRLEGEGRDAAALTTGDAFVIPPGLATRYAGPSAGFELLEVSLPGVFETELL